MKREFDFKVVNMLKCSASQQGYLETVKKDQHGNILSGRHRKKADPNWTEEFVLVKDELDRELKIIHYNVQRKPSKKETRERLLRVAKILESKGIDKPDICPAMAKLVPYSKRHLRRILPDEYKHVEFRSNSQSCEIDKGLFEYNIWEFPITRPPWGSAEFKGNCNGMVPYQVIRRYKPDAEFVIDPMAGSGTIVDVCRDFGIKCFAFDILGNQWHKDVRYGDATEDWNPPRKADVIFIHFPYWNIIRYTNEYDGPKDKDVSQLSLSEFLAKSEEILLNARDNMTEDGVLAVMIGDLRRKGKLYDLPSRFSTIGQKHFQLFDKIVKIGWGGHEASRGFYYGPKQLPFCKLGFETILVFKK